MKSVVLFSSGLDSTYNLYCAREQSDVILALTIDYGQRAATQECAMAARQCTHLGVQHKILKLNWFADFTQSSLVNSQTQVPQGAQVQIDELQTSQQTARAVWVPNRNGILLNIAAGFAEGMGADWIVPGFNREEAQTFPDNSEEFLQALNSSFKFSTQGRVQTKCFSTHLNKKEIVARSRALGVKFEWIWPCYFGETKPCGQCESCLRFQRAVNQ